VAINIDPSIDTDTKKFMQQNSTSDGSSPSWYEQALNSAATSLRRSQPQGYIQPSPRPTISGGPAAGGTPMTAEGNIAQQTAGQPQMAPPTQGPASAAGAGAPDSGPVTPNPSGAALPQGLRRYAGMPGVYAGRSRDGSLLFTDAPNDAFTQSAVDPRGLRRSDVNVGTYANDNSGAQVNQSNPNGYSNVPGAQGDYPMRTGTDQASSNRLFANMQGGNDPNAGNALPANSLASKGYDTSATGLSAMSPQDLTSAQNALAGQNPTGDGALADQALKGRLQARVENLRRGDYPGGPGAANTTAGQGAYGPYGGGMGGLGAGPGGGINPSTYLDYAKFGHEQQQDAVKDQQENARITGENLDRYQRQSDELNKGYNDALGRGDQTAADQLVTSAIPNFDNSPAGQASARQWAGSRSGQAALGLALNSLRRSAYNGQHLGQFYNKSVLNPQSTNVGWQNATFDSKGNFTGFTADPQGKGDMFNIAPTDPMIGRSPYSQDLIQRLQPLAKYLHPTANAEDDE
jgi:hypothetical protein